MLVWTCAMVHAETPQDTFAQIVAALIPPGDVGSMWKDLDAVEQIRWQPLPPTMLSTPLPGGAMFSRDGVATIAGRRVAVKAAGTRSTVTNVYFRNHGEAIGEDTVLAALTHRGLALQPARCPIRPSPAASDKWWTIKETGSSPNWFYSQTSCKGVKCEAFALFFVAPPPMTPEERKLYTDHCVGGGGR